MIELADVGQPPRTYRWSNEQYLSLVESGVVPDSRWIELIDGQVVESKPQGELHQFIFLALQRVLAAAGAFDHGLAVQPTIGVSEGDVFDPEFAFLRPQAVGAKELPSGKDVAMIVEVSVTSKANDLGPKRDAYARSGVPVYWVVDGLTSGVWVHEDPHDGEYRAQRFIEGSVVLKVPVVGMNIELGQLFPAP